MNRKQHLEKLEQAETLILKVAEDYKGFDEYNTMKKHANDIRELIEMFKNTDKAISEVD